MKVALSLSPSWRFGAAALLMASPLWSSAQTAVSPPGRLLASNCFQCHGTNGRGPGFERLAGQSANEIYDELREMRADLVSKGGRDIMVRHAAGYSDAQLLQLSQWLSQQTR